jgi:hypothetical protein
VRALIIPAPISQAPTVEDVDTEQPGVLQKIVGGYIEAYRIPDHEARMYMNEDGQRLALPINVRASDLLHTTVLGTVVVLGTGAEPKDGPVPISVLNALGTT